jgi:hypothetical protein|nr:hypothetical protein [uncultured Acetatifactor sp.]
MRAEREHDEGNQIFVEPWKGRLMVYQDNIRMRMNIGRTLFVAGLFLIGISKLWRFQGAQDKVFLATGLCFLMLKIAIEKNYTKNQITCFFGAFSMGALIFMKTGELNPFSLFIIVFSMKGIEIKKVLREVLALNLAFFVGTITLCKMGFIYDDIYFFSRPGQILARHSYGLGHPNQVFLRILVIGMIVVGCLRERHHKAKMVMTFVVSVLFYKTTNSRSGFLCILLFLAAVCMLDMCGGKKRKVITACMFVLYAFMAVLPIVFLFWDSRIIQRIDQMITGRIFLAKKFLASYSLSALGVDKGISESFVIDNSYMYILIHYGIIFYAIYVIAIGCLLYTMYKKKMAYEMAVVFMLHVYAFVECILINPIFNISVLFAGAFLMNPIESIKDGEDIGAFICHNACP